MTTRPATPLAAQLRPLARRVHFLAGILVAPFVLLLCLTGLVYVCSPQIHEDLYANQLFVPAVGDAARPVTEQVAAALAAHPEGELRAVVPPPGPDRTTRVDLAVPTLTRPGEARTVFVDPYTNHISGELTTVDGRMPANVWLRELHSDLHLGPIGRLYSEVAASWLPVLLVGGLLLWIAKQGRRRRSVRELLTPLPRGKGEQARMRAVHGPLGIWTTVGLLVLSVTGLTMSRFAGWGLPAVQAPELAAEPVAVAGGLRPVGVDRVLQVARAEGLDGELRVVAPTAPDRPYTVAETSPGLPIRRDSIAVDPYTAQVTERVGWDDYPVLAQLREVGQQAHTGTLFGVANQIVLALLVIATIVLVLVGYRMWWKRSPYQERGLPPVPQPALRELTPRVGVPVVLVTVVLGWLLPAFGLSLLAFIVVDLAVRAVRERQERLRSGITAGALLVAGSALGAAVVLAAPPPVTRVDAAMIPSRPAPEPVAPLVEPPLPVEVPPAEPPHADGAGTPQTPPGPAVRGVAPPAPGRAAGPAAAGPGGAGPTVAPPTPGERPAAADPARDTGDDADPTTDDDADRGDGSREDRDRDDARDPDPAAPPAETPIGVAAGPPATAPAPASPPAAPAPAPQPAVESPGLVKGLVGSLVETVDRVTSRILGG
ncbi:PepSY-associated TM helix domain-containing protein [Pseudonocardia zijingensis]|uniref:PepSY-associated TM helix domain-containing protein n=2 Tax=Pseudonocardia zijingensis TaxID=153376 RepID=UPI0036233DB5